MLTRLNRRSIHTAVVTLLALCGGAMAGAQEPAPGLDTIAQFDRYPLLVREGEAHYLSSFDRTGGNDDGFEGHYSALYVDENGEHVIFDAKGPGSVYTLWFTSRENGWAKLGWGRIRFYFDDETEPRLDVDVDELFSGRRPPFVAPFVFNAFSSTGGYACYLPFPYAHRLKITTQNRVGFYNIYYHTFAPDRRLASWTGREDTATVSRIWNQPGIDPKGPVDSTVFDGTIDILAPAMPDGDMVPVVSRLFEWSGTGAITAVRFNPLFPLTSYQLNHLWLRMYWDDEQTPSVNAPLGSFFGSGLGEASVRAVPLGMSPSGTYYCYLPMPFWKSVRVELVNENPGPVPKIWWEIRLAPDTQVRYPRAESGYFKARYRREWPTTGGKDYQILDTAGRGTYVGQVMTVEAIRSEIKRWWEGDLRVYIDERRQPAFHGTGHEDEYLGGWSNEWLMNPYSLPMHGEPATRDLTQVDFQWNASTTVYRFFPGGVPYQSHITVSTEHGVDNQAPAMYSSVAYYYEQPAAMRRADSLDVGSARDEQQHKYAAARAGSAQQVTAQFEGIASAVDVTDDCREVLGDSRFVLASSASGRALRLRRLYDQSNAQEAEVWVAGRLAGIWYSPATNTHKRWAESDFLIPAAMATGGAPLSVQIRVLKSPWSECRYELWQLP